MVQRHKFKPVMADEHVETRFSKPEDVLSRLEEYLTTEKMFTKTCVYVYIQHARYIVVHYGISTPTLDDATRIRADMIRRGLKPTTIRNRLNALEHLAGSQGVPLKVEKPRQTKRREVVHMTAKEARKLILAADNVRDRAIVATLLYCGLRAKELCALELEDVDMQRSKIMVRDGKNRESDAVAMSDELRSMMKDWLEARPLVEHQHVFMSTSGRPLQRMVLHKLVHDLGVRAGIEQHVYPHLCRHTCGTLLLDSGMTFREVGQHLRHKNPNSTLCYLHADRDVVREKVKKFKY